MAWHDLPTDADSGVTATINRTAIALTLSAALLRRAGWDQDVAVRPRIGSGDHAGWLRLERLDLGLPQDPAGDGIVVTVPKSAVAGVGMCTEAVLMTRLDADPAGGAKAIEVQLPAAQTKRARAHTVANTAEVTPIRPVIGPARPAAPAPAAAVTIVQAPAEWRELRKNLAAKGVTLNFYSNGKIVMNGREVAEADIRRRAGALLNDHGDGSDDRPEIGGDSAILAPDAA